MLAILLRLSEAPGIVVHELAHGLACLLTGTRIHEMRLFRFGDPPGYVIHDRAASATAGVLIAFAPTVVNALVGAAAAYGPTLSVLSDRSAILRWGWSDWALAWIGLSVAMRAFPSRADAKAMLEAAGAARFGWAKRIAVAPLWALAHLLSYGSRLWLHALFAILVCLAAPALKLARDGKLTLPF
jgi:hypothetical protein